MKDKKKKKSKKLIIFSSISFTFLFAITFTASYLFSTLGKINTKDIDQSDEALGISENKFSDEVVNIALFGIDGRTATEKGRSDSTMIASFDKKHKKIKLISLMRDSFVDIDGHGKDKLNHAYAFGGPELAIKTINQNFGLNIKDYISVNFEDLGNIIDKLGGVDINVKDYEVKYINQYVDDLSHITNLKAKNITAPGKQNLSGIQAVAYSRIRYAGDGDYERTERQRNVLEAIFNKVSNYPISKIPSTVSELLPFVETSLSATDIISLGTQVISSGTKTVEQERFPTDSNSEGGLFKRTEGSVAQWYLKFNKDTTKKEIFDYISNDIKPKN